MTDSENSETHSKRYLMGFRSEDYQIPEKLAAALAGVVIEWGGFENAIVTDTIRMMKQPSVRKLADEAPRNFKKKIALWKKCIRTLHPGDNTYSKWASEIYRAAKIVSTHRNRLIHGVWDRAEPKGRPGLYRIITFKGLDRVDEYDSKAIDAEYVEALRNDIRNLSDLVLTLEINRTLRGLQIQPKTSP